ncbi:response regulator transcription factor [Cohnella silvisoli]|uniref:Helix-turn-helix domain-containing protein n=1 Tax=Cohnella silvisoli TaxID=2873699 RepID=A0ABV1KZW8_9BACL|nr:response regulator [Cohnella silvisoli]MCD9024945.1 helix-turn-helix domain-containing protein [Cohnella silvisoli]
MYRLLIVDDEPAIVDGLVQHFQELEDIELDVCKAYSAIEALAIVKKTKIDLVISDIRMPGKSGLQLADDVLYYWPACRIILLTGYSEFDYVYSAIQKNVDNYILKTEGMEAIVGAIKAAVSKLDEETRNKDMLELAKRQMAAAEPLLKKQYFEALLLGEKASDIRHSAYFADLAIDMDDERPLLIVVGKADRSARDETYTEKLDLYDSIQDVFARQLHSLFAVEQAVHDHSLLVWFVQPAADTDKFASTDGGTDWRGITTYLKGMLEPVQNICRSVLGVEVSFALCRSEVEWDGIGKEYELLKSALKQHAVFGQPMAVIDLGLPDGLFKPEAAKPAADASQFNKKLGELTRSLEKGDEANADQLAKVLLSEIKNDLAANYLLGMERYYHFLLAFIGQMNDVLPAGLPVMDLPIQWGAAESQFAGLVQTICNQQKAQVEKGENMLVERIHQFIEHNMGGDLSLARIAEAVYFNPSYLSRFYKQLTGRNLSDYMNTAKSEAAQSMLAETQLKVNEVALRLGFESPSYFTAFFRKMTGSTPQEYRDRRSKQNRSM